MRPFIYILIIGCAVNAINMLWVINDIVTALDFVPSWDYFYYPETKNITINFHRAIAETLASVFTGLFGFLLLKRSQ